MDNSPSLNAHIHLHNAEWKDNVATYICFPHLCVCWGVYILWGSGRGLSVLNRNTIISGNKLHSHAWKGIPFQLDYLLIGPDAHWYF